MEHSMNYLECINKWQEPLTKNGFHDFYYGLSTCDCIQKSPDPEDATLEELVKKDCFVEMFFIHEPLEWCPPNKCYLDGEPTETALKEFIFESTGVRVEKIWIAHGWKREKDNNWAYTFVFS